MTTLKLAAVFAEKIQYKGAEVLGDTLCFTATSEQTDHLPFASILLGSSDTLIQYQDNASVGFYLVSERNILNQPLSQLGSSQLPGSIGIFPMVANPAIGPTAADKHWREVHAPLALEVHTAMTHYYQLNVVHRFSGPDWNGLAFCCFANESDLREKFYNSTQGKRLIAEDIVRFADTKRSPRKVVATVN
jgi:hypothetical protein